MKKVIWIVALALVVLFGWRLVQSISKQSDAGGNKQGKSGAAVPVELALIRVANMQDIGRFGGSLKPRAAYSLAPRVAGRLEKLLVRLGDKVANGQLVAVLDDAVYQQELEQARAEFAVAQAQVEQSRLALKAAEGNWNSVNSLFKKSYESQAVMDQADADRASAQAKFDIATADVQRAQAVLRKAEIQLSYTQIKAVWNGSGKTRLVGERFANEGDMLSTSTPILTLVDNSVVIAEIDVIERDYTRIKIGQQVEIVTDAYPQRTFSGTLVRLAPVLQEASRQARAEIDIPNPDGMLKPGMFVKVQIVYAQRKNVKVVPVAALVQRDEKTGVFIADKAALTVRFVPLTLGIRNEVNAEVLEPVIDGDVVILGQEQLQDGGKIKLSQSGEKDKSSKGKKGNRP
jgi:RND family efflux transporter MFP subunit